MRIRKHASMILGTGSSLPPPPEVAATAPGASSYGYICVLSQSPWDVLPCSQHIPPPPHKHNPQDAGEDLVANGMKGEETLSAITSTKAVLNNEIPTRREESGNMEAERDSKLNPAPAEPSKKAKGMRATVKKEKMCFGSTETDAAPIFTCKKTDGKQWRCRRPTRKPNSLCDYHFAQVQSYNYKAQSGSVAAKVRNGTRKKKVAKPADTLAGSDIYYYSTFGPWRNKHQGRGDVGQNQMAASAVAAAEESYIEEKSCDIVDDEESFEEIEVEEKEKRDETSGLISKRRKKRRKPIKARSLKSLM